eukprot:5891896-Alexandrium_andersonii.AAC.1
MGPPRLLHAVRPVRQAPRPPPLGELEHGRSGGRAVRVPLLPRGPELLAQPARPAARAGARRPDLHGAAGPRARAGVPAALGLAQKPHGRAVRPPLRRALGGAPR